MPVQQQQRTHQNGKNIILISATKPMLMMRSSNQLASYLWQTKSIRKELGVITEHSPRSYVESIYTKYMASVDENLINTAITTAGKFRDCLHDCENGVLQLAGVGNELTEVHSALRDVNMIIGWLEELYCYVMSDVAELVDMHASQKLMYQA